MSSNDVVGIVGMSRRDEPVTRRHIGQSDTISRASSAERLLFEFQNRSQKEVRCNASGRQLRLPSGCNTASLGHPGTATQGHRTPDQPHDRSLPLWREQQEAKESLRRTSREPWYNTWMSRSLPESRWDRIGNPWCGGSWVSHVSRTLFDTD